MQIYIHMNTQYLNAVKSYTCIADSYWKMNRLINRRTKYPLPKKINYIKMTKKMTKSLHFGPIDRSWFANGSYGFECDQDQIHPVSWAVVLSNKGNFFIHFIKCWNFPNTMEYCRLLFHCKEFIKAYRWFCNDMRTQIYIS